MTGTADPISPEMRNVIWNFDRRRRVAQVPWLKKIGSGIYECAGKKELPVGKGEEGFWRKPEIGRWCCYICDPPPVVKQQQEKSQR